MINEIVLKEVTSVLGTLKKQNNLWYLKEATTNNFTCRSKETGTLFFIYTNRGNLKFNPDFVSLVPEKSFCLVIDYLEKRFPELEKRFQINTPKASLMMPWDMVKVKYSKF
jgi:hypothetical protein